MTVHILVGSTSGNTEYLAETLHHHIQKKGLTSHFHDVPSVDEVPIENTTWLICLATHGAGEFAESIAEFMEDLNQQRPSLSNVNYALIAVGDSSYDTFCQAGIDAEKLLNDLKATPLIDRLDIDMATEMDPEGQAQAWLEKISNKF